MINRMKKIIALLLIALMLVPVIHAGFADTDVYSDATSPFDLGRVLRAAGGGTYHIVNDCGGSASVDFSGAEPVDGGAFTYTLNWNVKSIIADATPENIEDYVFVYDFPDGFNVNFSGTRNLLFGNDVAATYEVVNNQLQLRLTRTDVTSVTLEFPGVFDVSEIISDGGKTEINIPGGDPIIIDIKVDGLDVVKTSGGIRYNEENNPYIDYVVTVYSTVMNTNVEVRDEMEDSYYYTDFSYDPTGVKVTKNGSEIGTINGDNWSYTVDELDVGDILKFEYRVWLDIPTDGSTSMNAYNTAYAKSNESNQDSSYVIDYSYLPSISKSNQVNEDGTITWRITVNSYDYPGVVTVKDDTWSSNLNIPDDTSVSISGGSMSSTTIGDLKKGIELTGATYYTLSFTVAAPESESGYWSVTNTAEITSPNRDSASSTASKTEPQKEPDVSSVWKYVVNASKENHTVMWYVSFAIGKDFTGDTVTIVDEMPADRYDNNEMGVQITDWHLEKNGRTCYIENSLNVDGRELTLTFNPQECGGSGTYYLYVTTIFDDSDIDPDAGTKTVYNEVTVTAGEDSDSDYNYQSFEYIDYTNYRITKSVKEIDDDVITWEIDLPYAGRYEITDVIPNGLEYISGSAILTGASGTRAVTPSGSANLKFDFYNTTYEWSTSIEYSKLELQTRVADWASMTESKTFTNVVKFDEFNDNTVGTEASADATVNVKPCLNKKVSKNDPEPGWYTFTITFNDSASSVFPEGTAVDKTITLKDTLGSAFSFIPSTVKVYKNGSLTNECSVVFNGQVMMISGLKDATAYKVVYSTQTTQMGGGIFDPATATNTVEADGIAVEESTTTVIVTGEITAPTGSVTVDGDRAVRVFKKDENGNKLPDAEFTLYKVMNGNLTDPKSKTTGSDGFTDYWGIDSGDLYYLMETRAPAGYIGSEDAYYFVWGTGPSYEYSDPNVHVIPYSYKSYTIEFSNRLGLSSATVQKTVSGNMGDTAKTFNFEYKTVDSKGVESDLKNIVLGHNQTAELKDLPIGGKLLIRETGASDYNLTVSGATLNDSGWYVMEISQTSSNNMISFDNEKNGNIDTGVSLDVLPYVLLLMSASVVAVMMFSRKRRRN